MDDVETADSATLDSKSISELKIRLGLLNKIIREAQKVGDDRWKEPARQQRAVNEVLIRKIKEARHQAGEPEPEPIRVGMQSARLKGRAITGAR